MSVIQRFVHNGEIELAVFDYGNPEAETIILVHGWPDTHELWTHVITQLKEHFHVVAYDSRGAGQSTIPEDVASYTLDKLAIDFFAVAQAVSPEKPVHVLAHDWGAVAMWEAVCEPEAQHRIATYSSVSGPNLDYLSNWARRKLFNPTPKNLWYLASQLLASAYTILFQIPGAATLPLKLFFSKKWPQFLGFFDGLDSQLVVTSSTLSRDMVNGLKLYRANIRARLANPRTRVTNIPVQLIINRRDHAVRPCGYEYYHKSAVHLVRQELDSGHWAPFSHAAELAKITRSFINSQKKTPEL
ncbi:MAG: alpha/beta fold hydrolase [Mycobacteriaceae bacterium]